MSDIVARKQYPDGYPTDALEVLKAMSFTNGEHVNIVGSMSLRSQIYAGDYDTIEVVKNEGSKESVLKHLASKFKSIIRQLNAIPLTYIGDIKCGSVEEWKVMHEPYNEKKSKAKMHELREKKIISQSEYIEGIKLLKPRLTRLDKIEALNTLRYHIVRWRPSEILQGHKILVDGRTFTLEEGFESPTIAKVDVISWVQNSRFTDFSMIYEFHQNNSILNPGMRDIEQSIRENVYKLKSDGNYFKMAKRMFALAKYKNHTHELRVLSNMFNSDLGRLYHVYGDIGTLEYMVETLSSLPYSRIEFEINQFKSRLSNIGFPEYLQNEPHILALIDNLINLKKSTYTKERLTIILKSIRKEVYTLLTDHTKVYLKEHDLFP